MAKHISVQLLAPLENWLSIAVFLVLNDMMPGHRFFCLNFSVRQGCVLSSLLFAIILRYIWTTLQQCAYIG